MKLRWFLMIVAAAGFASTLFAEADIGGVAPPIAAGVWHNLPEGLKSLSKDDMKGQIVMVEFWATWCGPCRASVPHLIELQEKYKDKGVVLVSLSYEADNAVAKFIGQMKIPYIVGSEATATRDAFGIQGYPTAFLIDPAGKVAWKGHPMVAEQAIEDLLKKTDPIVQGKLAEHAADRALARADKLKSLGRYADALAAYEKITTDFKSQAASTKAQERAAEIRDDGAIMESIRRAEVDKKAKRWLDMARVLASHGATQDAARYYGTLLKKYPDSQHAEIARGELKSLQQK